MHVDAAETGQVENVLAEDLSKSGDHDEVGVPGQELFLGFGAAQALGLDDLQAEGKGQSFNRWRSELLPAPGRAIGLGDYTEKAVIAAPGQMAQGWQGKVG